MLVSTTWYYYTNMGNVERVVTSAKDSDVCESTWFRYAVDDQTATMIIGETWNWNGVDPPDPQSYAITYGREFRYDQARARYLTRVLDPAALEAGNLTTVSKVWSDYDGDVVYGDYTVSFTVPTNVRSYEPGMGKVEPWTSMGAASTSYYSTDMLGTTRYMTTPDDGQKERGGATGGGLPTDGATFTAFGERICTLDGSCGAGDPNHRYGYAGAHGYRSHTIAEVADLDPPLDPDGVLPFLHVGARYYDPAIGRFLQRDPIGITGGLNVYAYVFNSPMNGVDPTGLWSFFRWIYTGDGNASDEVYGAAKDAGARWLNGSSAVRGAYFGFGMKNNRGFVFGAGGSWTLDEGGSAWAGGGFSWSGRGRDPSSGRFESQTFGGGFGATWGENGFNWSPFGGGGRNQKGHGGHATVSACSINIGINFGFFNFGFTVDPTRL